MKFRFNIYVPGIQCFQSIPMVFNTRKDALEWIDKNSLRSTVYVHTKTFMVIIPGGVWKQSVVMIEEINPDETNQG